jgi:hypothetical protein
MNNINDTIIKANLTKLHIEKLWKLMTDKLNNISATKYILLLGLGNPYFYDLACRYFKKELIYIIEDISSKFLYLGRTDVQNIKFINLKNINEDIFNNMEFDKIIMNPPFGKNADKTSNNLHYSITAMALTKLSKDGECISLMPNTLIYAPSKSYDKIKKTYDNKLISIQEYNSKDIFPETNMKNICTYFFKNNKSNNEICINSINNESIRINTLINFNLMYSEKETLIFNKYKQFNKINFAKKRITAVFAHGENKDNIPELVNKFLNNKKIQSYDFFIVFSRANGALDAKWQSGPISTVGILAKNELFDYLCENTKAKALVGFTKNEYESCKKLLNLINTNCLRFILAKTQDQQSITEKCYEYFPDIDYSKINNEKDFYEYFGITEEEQKLIEETMEKYK